MSCAFLIVFKQKTAYEMRISDWSSDVCSSDLPVGSRTLSKLTALNLSPASIRNVMQDLEELGLLSSPHTSAGRMPTEQGLRLFVDGMMQVAEPSAEDRAQIEASLSEGGPIESALAQATRSEEHTSELQSLMRISYAVYCLTTN